MQYTNQTAEELELYRCTSSGIFQAQNSIWMKINFAFTFSLILLTFVISIKAVQVLKFRNVYSTGTQFLLYVILVNVNFNQLVYMVIRIRHLQKILSFSKDPCLIEFHNSECYYDNHLYMFSNYLATWLVCSLTFDRFLAYYTSKLYDDKRNSKRIGVMLVVGSLFFTLLCHLYIFYGVPRAGYVPSCQYPPQLALDTFQLATILKIVFTLFNCFVILLLLLVVVRKDRRIRHRNYDTNTRYFSFENVLTTKSILTIAVTQLLFSCLSSVAVTLVRHFEGGMSEYLFHTLTQYVTGLLYGNLSIPILIYLKTSQCITDRHKRITRMTLEPDLMESRMISLKKMWEK
ncbi:CBN-SRA-30 protein [Caenorhabditis brenneri]|uniref:CBN-SRA-30 protein n=1 Tax=Caenorhabditis brenneri TaxID=135651 RepID=G0NQ85_CAEBE|nr:CBN-SRA-30 protein [Caenorhabditis brenneri]